MRPFHLFLAVAVAASAVSADTLSTLRGVRRIPAPAVTAPVNWAAVPAQGGFVCAGSTFVPDTSATAVRVAHDGANLLVRMEMTEPNGKLLEGRESFSLGANDYAEVLVVTPETRERGSCLHCSVDCAGHVSLTEDRESTELPGTWNMKKLDPKLVTMTAERTAEGWRADFVIPGSDFSGVWKANFARFHRKPYAFASWSLSKTFSDQKRFGEIVFGRTGGNGEAYEAALASFQVERKELFARYKERTYPWRWAWGATDGYRPLGVAYEASRGYGWTGPFVCKEVAKDAKRRPASPLAGSFVLGEEASGFRADLPDGDYVVHVLSCPNGKMREFAIRANGEKVIDFSVGGGESPAWNFPVTVRSGRLELAFEPRDVRPRPQTAGFASVESCLVRGFVVNSIVIFPAADRKAAKRQLAADELELRVMKVEELAKRERVENRDPEPTFEMPASAHRRGWVLFSRYLGENIYAGSRPRSRDELVGKLRVRAAPGEKFNLAFGILPLADSVAQPWTCEGFPLRVREVLREPWGVGEGRYDFVPYALEEAEFVDRDLESGVARGLWLTGRVPADAKPGVLKAAFRIGRESVPVEIEVLPFHLDEVDFAYGGYFPSGCGRPLCYEDVTAKAFADSGLNAFVLYPYLAWSYPGRNVSAAFDSFKAQIRIFREAGIRGHYVAYCSLRENVDQDLRHHRISELPQSAIDDQIAFAREIVGLRSQFGDSSFYYTSMDEAHCKGEPYWGEQIRLFKAVKGAVPEVITCGSESERSYRRSQPYMDIPILFEVPDFNALKGVSQIWSYPNQMMLDGENANAGRFCTGLLPVVTSVRGILPWQLMRGRAGSPLAADPWEMMIMRGVGGYRVIPRLVTALGEVGITDQRYFATLRRMIASAQKGPPEARRAAERQQLLLDMVREETKPSFMYYHYNGHLPAETYETLRKRLVDGILSLRNAGLK